jgi:transposase
MRSTPVWFRTDEGMAVTTMPDTTRRVTIGVDTHRDFHMVCVLDERGAELGVQPFSADPAGYRKTLAWAASFGTIEAAGVEGTGTYGAGLTRYLHNHDVSVIEVSCPNRQRRRSHGKSDPVDAVAAARAAQSGEANAQPKTRTGNVEAIRALRLARRSAAHHRVDALNQMRALLVTGPDELRATFRGTTVTRMIAAAARLRPTDPTTASGATNYALRALAHRVQNLETEIGRLDAILRPLITATAPDLVARHGVGPDTAGALLVAAGDNPGRLRNEAAFAHLCGSAPIDASSGLVKRHRLNRGGNRTANQALWRIVMVRMVSDPRTRFYVERRTKEGLSKKEIIRCLKRYVARELYPYLTPHQKTT